MKAQRAMLLVGSFWELVRFFLVLLLFAATLQAATGVGPWVYPWLLLVGSGNLLIVVGAFMLALFPDRYGPLVAFLRLGKGLAVFSFALLVVSGGLRATALQIVMEIGPVPVTQEVVLVLACLLDMLFLGALLAWRGTDHQAPPPRAEADLPAYKETEIKDLP